MPSDWAFPSGTPHSGDSLITIIFLITFSLPSSKGESSFLHLILPLEYLLQHCDSCLFRAPFDRRTTNSAWLRNLSALFLSVHCPGYWLSRRLVNQHVASVLLFLLHSLSVQTEGPSIQPLALRSSSARSSSLHPSICPLNAVLLLSGHRERNRWEEAPELSKHWTGVSW